MDGRTFGIIELVLFFGCVIGFCLWQLYSLRRDRRKRDSETSDC